MLTNLTIPNEFVPIHHLVKLLITSYSVKSEENGSQTSRYVNLMVKTAGGSECFCRVKSV